MATQYPNNIDTTGTLPYVVDGVSPVVAADVNRLRDTLVAIESELGASPSGVNTTVADRMTAFEATFTSFAPESATYLVLSSHISLSNERLITMGTGLVATDGGAGGSYTVELDESGAVAGTYIGATVIVDGYGRVVSASDGGIGTSVPGGIAGSVLFVDSGGVLGQDGYNFVWDNLNSYLGIGTATPGSLLTLAIDGSAANPVISFGNIADPDTGIWHPAANTLAFSTNGAEKLRISDTAVTTSVSTVYGDSGAHIVFEGTSPHFISVEDSLTSSGGSLFLSAGEACYPPTASFQAGGDISLSAGTGGYALDLTYDAGNGGGFYVQAGHAGDGEGDRSGAVGGNVSLTAGNGGDGGTTTIGGDGGYVIIISGSGGHAGTTTGAGGAGGITYILSGNGGNADATGTSGAGIGGGIVIRPGEGGPASTTGPGASGGPLEVFGGLGSPATTGAGIAGAGGAITLTAGSGGSSAISTNAAGTGGTITLSGGTGGVDIGAGGNNGGNVIIRGGPLSGAGTNGIVAIGDINTSAVNIGATGVTTAILGGVQTVAGSAAAPTYSFISANDGMFHYNDGFGDHLGFSVDGVETASIDAAGIKNLDGSDAVPSYAFSSDADTGMFLLSANVLGLSAGGTGLMYLGGGVVQGYGTSSFQLYSGVPSAANPAYAFVSDANTGIYNNAADELATSTGGASCRFVNRIVSTTDATATAIWTMPTASDNTYLVEYLVVARSNGLTINSASYHGTILARNNTGTLTLYQNPIWIAEDEPAWYFTGVVSGSNLNMTVSGDVGVSINWAGTFRIISVASP